MKKILFLVILFLSEFAFGHDGDHCNNPFFQNQHGITTGVQGFFGQYDAVGTEFDYFVTTAELGYNYKNKFFATVRVPFVTLQNQPKGRFLLSDTQVQLQGSVLTWGETDFLSLGINAEFPSGSEDKLVGNGHVHTRPYVGFQQSFDELITYGQVGYVFSATQHDHSDPGEHVGEPATFHGSVVDVHTDREITFQAGATLPVIHDLYFNTSVAGQTVMIDTTNSNIGDFYMTINPALTLIMTENSTFTMFTQIPVTELKRFDYRFGAGLNYIF